MIKLEVYFLKAITLLHVLYGLPPIETILGDTRSVDVLQCIVALIMRHRLESHFFILTIKHNATRISGPKAL
jgi:hypothetical protein